MKTYAGREKRTPSRTIDQVSQKTVAPEGLLTQFRKSKSRGTRGRTYVLPTDVVNHVFTNSFNGSGFHATTDDPNKKKYIVSEKKREDRAKTVYKADHLGIDGSIVAVGKTMFPDSFSQNKVISIIQRALTNPDLTSGSEKQRINQEGTTETSNRTLPAPIVISGKSFIRGKADGIRIEALMNRASIANAYPLI